MCECIFSLYSDILDLNKTWSKKCFIKILFLVDNVMIQALNYQTLTLGIIFVWNSTTNWNNFSRLTQFVYQLNFNFRGQRKLGKFFETRKFIPAILNFLPKFFSLPIFPCFPKFSWKVFGQWELNRIIKCLAMSSFPLSTTHLLIMDPPVCLKLLSLGMFSLVFRTAVHYHNFNSVFRR